MAAANSDDGIVASNACTISGCTTYLNAGDGIRVPSDCLVVGNTCDSNGTGDGAGIDVDGTGNIIIRNTCSGNTTNWDIAAGNAVAPIVQASTNAAAISGNTYAGSLGSTDPNANFTY